METRSIYAILLTLIIPLFAYGVDVNNPSMEGAFISQPPLGDVAEYWTGWGLGEAHYNESYSAHEGTKSQEIEWIREGSDQFGPEGIYQQIGPLQQGQAYRVSVWFKFDLQAFASDWTSGKVTCSVGTDPDGGTNAGVVTNWGSASDSGYDWYNVVTFFGATTDTATLFTRAEGEGDGWVEEPEPGPGMWMALVYIDDVNVATSEVGLGSIVEATSPVSADGVNYSTVTITVLDSNGGPFEGIPGSEINIECTGSENIIIAPENPTNEAGVTTAKIKSTVAESKVVNVTVLGTVLTDTAEVVFEEVEIGIEATSPVPANHASYSEVTITVLDYNSNPIQDIPPSAIDVNCSGSGNFIYGLDSPTDVNGQTTVKITSTIAETKTVRATIFGTVLSDTITVHFCQSSSSRKLRASDGAHSDYFGFPVSISGNCAIVGAWQDNDNGTNSGSAYIFAPNELDPNNWDQQAKLTASDGATYDYFGRSVSISGDYAIVGAYGNDDNGSRSGSAYIFAPDSIDSNNWVQKAKLNASDAASGDYFGISVSISGDYAIVGAYLDNDNGSNSGSAYVFHYNGSTWIEEAKLLASDGSADDYFGSSVSISGNYAIVGAWQDDDNGSKSGSAYVFRYNGSTWVEEAKMLASDGAADDYFGRSVSISRDYAIVGAVWDDDNGSKSGSAYIFAPNSIDPSNWVQQTKLTASDGEDGDYFGQHVSISVDYAIVGAYGDDDYSGSAYIFAPNSIEPNNWVQQAKLTAVDGVDGDYFGSSVSISGNCAIVGAYRDDDNGYNSGSAYVFYLNVHLGDFNADGHVDFADFSILADHWMELPGQPPADIAPCGGGCIIDFLDLKVFCDHWLE